MLGPTTRLHRPAAAPCAVSHVARPPLATPLSRRSSSSTMCKSGAQKWADTQLAGAQHASELDTACLAVQLASKLCQVSSKRRPAAGDAAPQHRRACDRQQHTQTRLLAAWKQQRQCVSHCRLPMHGA